MKRRRWAAFAAAAALGTACSSGGTPPATRAIQREAAVTAARGSGIFGLTILPEMLLEKPALTPTERQLERNRRTTPLCNSLDTLDTLSEPAPDDAPALVNFAANYHAHLMNVDVKKKIEDRETDNEIAIPDPILDALRDQRAHIYAFQTRVSMVSNQDQDIPDAVLRAYIDWAFVQLVNSSFTKSGAVLDAALVKYCQDDS